MEAYPVDPPGRLDMPDVEPTAGYIDLHERYAEDFGLDPEVGRRVLPEHHGVGCRRTGEGVRAAPGTARRAAECEARCTARHQLVA